MNSYDKAKRIISTTEELSGLPVRVVWDEKLEVGAVVHLSEIDWAKQIRISIKPGRKDTDYLVGLQCAMAIRHVQNKDAAKNLVSCEGSIERVRELTRRNNPLSMYQVIQELNNYLRGWVGYFGIQEFKYLFRNFDAWMRSRVRSTQLKKWKKPGKFQRIMIKAGFDPTEAHRVWIKMNRWLSVMRRPVRFVMNLEWFRGRGLVFLHDYTRAFS